MKAIIFIITLITSSYIAFAQDSTMQNNSTKSQPPKPASKVGVMFGWQWEEVDIHSVFFDGYDDGWKTNNNITAFYNYTYDRNFFFAFNLSYNIYKTNYKTDNDFAATIGLN